jgi:hypothetical protein
MPDEYRSGKLVPNMKAPLNLAAHTASTKSLYDFMRIFFHGLADVMLDLIRWTLSRATDELGLRVPRRF